MNKSIKINYKIVMTIIIALLFVFIVSYIAQIRQSNSNIQFDTAVKTNNEIIKVQVTAYIIKADFFTSSRDKQNIINLFEHVNIIWSQANIQIELEEIKILDTQDSAISNALKGNQKLLINTAYNPDSINIYFARTLGVNGIALPNKIVFVADKTTVNDFRATSHEIGHVIGLKHVSNINQLMARGVNGITLTENEINVARNNALIFN